MTAFSLRAPVRLRMQAALAAAGGITITEGVFEWAAPAGGSTPTGYRIYWGTSTGNYSTGNQDAGNVVSYALSNLGLSNGTMYYMVVRAYNGAGEGTSSNEIQVLNGVQVGP